MCYMYTYIMPVLRFYVVLFIKINWFLFIKYTTIIINNEHEGIITERPHLMVCRCVTNRVVISDER